MAAVDNKSRAFACSAECCFLPSAIMSSDVRPLHADATARSKANRAERLSFPPSYVVVGVYRLLSDKNLYVPAWQKCKHGFLRGAVIGLGWVRRHVIEMHLRLNEASSGCAIIWDPEKGRGGLPQKVCRPSFLHLSSVTSCSNDVQALLGLLVCLRIDCLAINFLSR